MFVTIITHVRTQSIYWTVSDRKPRVCLGLLLNHTEHELIQLLKLIFIATNLEQIEP